MRNRLLPILLAIFFIINISGMHAVSAEASTSFTLSASNGNARVGDQVTITVKGVTVKDLFSYELLLTYDKDKLEPVGSPVSQIDGASSVKVRENTIQFGCTKQVSKTESAANLSICTFTFRLMAEGTASVRLDWFKIYNMQLQEQKYTVNKSTNIIISKSGNTGDSGYQITVPAQKPNADGEAEIVIEEEELAKGFAVNPLITINVPGIAGASSYLVNLPSEDMMAGNAGRSISIVTEIGSVRLLLNLLVNIKSSDDLKLKIARVGKTKLSKTLQAQIGDRPVMDLSFIINGKAKAWSNADSPVYVSLPYKPAARELTDPEHIVLWYVAQNGKTETIPTGRYDAGKGIVTFQTTHFSQYAVGYATKTFKDLEKYKWAQKEIGVMASKGIVDGVSADKYSPQTNITRGDFMLYLVRALGLTAKVDGNFADVSKTAIYYEALGIAKKLNITKGTGNNRFQPNALITRQDMVATAYRAIDVSGLKLEDADRSVLDKFADKSRVASYAVDGLSMMVKNGVISGSGGRIEPLRNTTRAEAAVILYRLYQKCSGGS